MLLTSDEVVQATIRENTERPVTVEQGTNYLVGTDPAAERIADILLRP